METQSTSKCSIMAAGVLGACLIVSVWLGTSAYMRVKAMSNGLTVTGSAEREITSDTAKWASSFAYQVSLDTLKDGNKKMVADLETIKKYFAEQGIPAADIAVEPMSMMPLCEGQTSSPYYDRSGNQTCGTSRTVGYQLQQTITVETKEVDKATKLSQIAGTVLLDRNIMFTSISMEYYSSKLANIKLEMLDEATKNSKIRAEKIVGSTGAKLGDLQSASMGVFQVTQVNSTEISDYGTYDTSSIQKKVTSIVRTTWGLK